MKLNRANNIARGVYHKIQVRDNSHKKKEEIKWKCETAFTTKKASFFFLLNIHTSHKDNRFPAPHFK